VVFLKSQCDGRASISGFLAVISELLELGSEIWYREYGITHYIKYCLYKSAIQKIVMMLDLRLYSINFNTELVLK
jgi:hypothetical protein